MTRRLLTPLLLLTALLTNGFAQRTARVVKYHSNDIVAVKAKLGYSTLIELPATEKILEVATGDKDFWIIDASSNHCFLHPAKQSIHSNLNLITDKRNVYSFTLDEVEEADPDLKVVIEPSDASSIAAANAAAKFVPASDLEAAEARAEASQKHAAEAIEQFRSDYATSRVKFDYRYRNDQPFSVVAIFEDGQFTYIKSTATEKFSLYEVKDGQPNLINFQLQAGTYVIPKVVDRGYLEIGKHRLNFERVAQ